MLKRRSPMREMMRADSGFTGLSRTIWDVIRNWRG